MSDERSATLRYYPPKADHSGTVSLRIVFFEALRKTISKGNGPARGRGKPRVLRPTGVVYRGAGTL
jgi:hypothetical protein